MNLPTLLVGMENEIVQLLGKIVWWFLSKLNIKSPQTQILLLGICPKEFTVAHL